jgi:uncharacterized protein YqhQ
MSWQKNNVVTFRSLAAAVPAFLSGRILPPEKERAGTSLPSVDRRGRTAYGGQAVIEGVMMRGRTTMAVAVRRPDGTIQTKVEPLSGIYQSRIVKTPVLRGVLLLWDTIGLGWKSIEFSAQAQGEEPVSKGEWVISLLVSLAILIGVFLLLPTAIGQWTEGALRAAHSGAAAVDVTHSAQAAGASAQIPVWLPAAIGNLVEGVIRLGLLILYLLLVARIPEIARVFSYHGAEHKTVAAYEAGVELTPEAAERFPKEHPRCGTSFLIAIGVLAILLFAFTGSMPMGYKLLSRILGIPVLIALGYEYLRFSASVKNPTLARILGAPGVWAQKFTTREPDRSMLEVAIAALQAVRAVEEPPAERPPEPMESTEGGVTQTEPKNQ